MHNPDINPEIEQIDRRVKWALLVVSILTIVFLAASALSENVFPEWRTARKAYAKILDQKATDEQGREIASHYETKIEQNVLPGLDRIDRCITCHAGVDDPRMKDQAQPYTAHPGKYLQAHEINKFGCTICHQGQGRATQAMDAHGEAPFWDYPLLKKRYMTASCSRCHETSQLHGEDGLIAQMHEDDEPYVASDDLLAMGKELTDQRGCKGCHAIGGKGVSLAIDLTLVGDKTAHQFDFSHVHKGEPREVDYWLEQHFLNPQAIIPASSMPVLAFNEQEAHALTAYMLSLTNKISGPYDKRPAFEPFGDPTGEELYGTYCSACHGAKAQGTETIGAPALAHQEPWYLMAQLEKFRAGLRGTHIRDTMGAQMALVARTLPDETMLRKVVNYIETIEGKPPAPTMGGSAATGGSTYPTCMACHGPRGEGLQAMNSPALTGLNDWYIVKQLSNFREGIRGANPADVTGAMMKAMAMAVPSADVGKDISAYLQSLPPPPHEEAVESQEN